jgi:hypothetical protein
MATTRVKLGFTPTSPEIEELQAAYTARYKVHGLDYKASLMLGRLTTLRASAYTKAVADSKTANGGGRMSPFHLVTV